MTTPDLPTGYGQIAYDAYVADCGGLSIHGETLPAWPDQSEEIRQHWDAAAAAVIEYIDRLDRGPL